MLLDTNAYINVMDLYNHLLHLQIFGAFLLKDDHRYLYFFVKFLLGVLITFVTKSLLKDTRLNKAFTLPKFKKN